MTTYNRAGHDESPCRGHGICAYTLQHAHLELSILSLDGIGLEVLDLCAPIQVSAMVKSVPLRLLDLRLDAGLCGLGVGGIAHVDRLQSRVSL